MRRPWKREAASSYKLRMVSEMLLCEFQSHPASGVGAVGEYGVWSPFQTSETCQHRRQAWSPGSARQVTLLRLSRSDDTSCVGCACHVRSPGKARPAYYWRPPRAAQDAAKRCKARRRVGGFHSWIWNTFWAIQTRVIDLWSKRAAAPLRAALAQEREKRSQRGLPSNEPGTSRTLDHACKVEDGAEAQKMSPKSIRTILSIPWPRGAARSRDRRRILSQIQYTHGAGALKDASERAGRLLSYDGLDCLFLPADMLRPFPPRAITVSFCSLKPATPAAIPSARVERTAMFTTG
ncbi:hypothetical protein BDV96DRAFT_660392 [Lophiotrema nucula]|uniref:Uncharacterized protein n=1 Tax=Lophiotrema nucula TaxID=690887 RepID=A0A6A5Z6B0_9PLEO|nr:hypothetical protein BDV96DRAFT_660392 [Lophiotrema nucula]